MRMQLRLLNEIVEAVKAMRWLCEHRRDGNQNADELCGHINDVASELLFEVAQILVDYECSDALRVLHKLYFSEIAYEDFEKMVVDYRQPIVGDEQPDDWELPFYGLLMLTEPVIIEPIPIDEEAYDEGA
jgi:hypothetical protein